MSSHDYVIANQTGANFRADLNLALLADQSQNSGTSEPSTTYAYQWWADTTTGLLKQRNAANNAWISILTLSTGAVATATSATTASSLTLGSDAQGDIAYRGASDYDRLAKGTGSQTLRMNSGATAPEWVSVLAEDQSWTGSQRATLVTDNDGSFDLNLGQNFKCTPAGGLTLTFTNFANGQSGFIILVNSGGHAIARHSDTIADANFVATVSAAGTYIISYISDGTDAFLTNSAIMA